MFDDDDDDVIRSCAILFCIVCIFSWFLLLINSNNNDTTEIKNKRIPPSYSRALSTMNSIERSMLSVYIFSDSNNFPSDYSNLINGLNDNRSIKVNDNGKLRYTIVRARKKDVPFCGMYEYIKMDEMTINQDPAKNTVNTISSQYIKLFGKDIEKVCVSPPIHKAVDVKENIKTVTVEKLEILAPSLYDELIQSVKTCKRGSTLMLELTDNGRYLTIVDYNDVMKVIAGCKRYQLEKALNEN